jgi:hypothetical protein
MPKPYFFVLTKDYVHQPAGALEETTRRRGAPRGGDAVADLQLRQEPLGTKAQETRGLEKADRTPSQIEALGFLQFVGLSSS